MMFKLSGPFALPFWTMVFLNFVLPVVVLSRARTRTIPGILIVSIGVVIGMWLERLIIVVPSLSVPYIDFPVHPYWPTFTEVSLFAAGISAFCLGFMLFAKFFPLISVWETEEGMEHAVRETTERVESYLPDPVAPVVERPEVLPRGGT